MEWQCRDRLMRVDGRPLVMGILNVTPDSFSDGGRFCTVERAVAHARRMVDDGAAIVDIGGESTRPGAEAVSEDEELARVIPVIEALAGLPTVLSIDTMKARVAREAVAAGVHIVNDVSACTHDAAMPGVVAETGAGVILMHMCGTPRTMQVSPSYVDVVTQVRDYLAVRVAALTEAGVDRRAIAVDPGIGFGKTVEHNLALLANLDRLSDLPVVVGLSRKRFLGAVTGREVDDRLVGSLAGLACAVLCGARIVRVHDVRESVDAAAIAARIEAYRKTPTLLRVER